MVRRDLYELLGVEPSASSDDIRAAFRNRAKVLHPDLHPDDPVMARRFADLTEAYEVLRRPARRAAYDRRRATGAPTMARVVVPVLGTPRRARVALWSGAALVVAGIAGAVALAGSEGGGAKAVTLWIVVAKLVVCGAGIAGAGAWRLHGPPSGTRVIHRPTGSHWG